MGVPLFQFHKGTIRTKYCKNLLEVYGNFNSIKVRLEPNALEIVNRAYKFQFHKGTIRTLNAGINTAFGEKFQFHKGTIRTESDINFDNQIDYFNSIKVRLELLRNMDLNQFPKFQFHKGTIRTKKINK